jgi:hypothetical protein
VQLFKMIIVKQKIFSLFNIQVQKSVQILLQIIRLHEMMILAPKLFSNYFTGGNYVFNNWNDSVKCISLQRVKNRKKIGLGLKSFKMKTFFL